MLTFAIVGGGPTGVELAGAIAEIVGRRKRWLPTFARSQPHHARVLLIEAVHRFCPAFPERLSAVAKRGARAAGRRGQARRGLATACDDQGVMVGDERIQAGVVLRAVRRRITCRQWLSAESDRAGRVKVGARSDAAWPSQIFVIGDTALATDPAGNPSTGIAAAAKQAGKYVAGAIRARLRGRPTRPIRATSIWGNLATIGRTAAVAISVGFA